MPFIAARDAPAYAAEFAANAAVNDVYAAAYDADTIYAVSAYVDTIAVINADLVALEGGLSGAELLCIPFWVEEAPEKWQLLKDRFCADMRSLEAGFVFWGTWYEARLQGLPLDPKEGELLACLSPALHKEPVDRLNDVLLRKQAVLYEDDPS